eukprot:282291_1
MSAGLLTLQQNMEDEDEDYECECAVVCDNGSGMTKAGFAGHDAPRAVFPTIIGRPNHTGSGGMGLARAYNIIDVFVGDEAQAKRGILRMSHPMEGGVITNWDDMERIWHHTWYNELRIGPEEYPFLMTESPFSPQLQREKSTQIMFERFNVPKFYLISTSLLACYSHDEQITAVVLESGDGGTTVTPIYEGYTLSVDKENSLDLTGTMFTEYLSKLLTQNKGYSFTTTREKEDVLRIKQNCYCALDYDKELVKSQNTTDIQLELKMGDAYYYDLPDGETITVNESRFQCSEPLFNPHLIGIENRGGVHQMIYDAVMKCDVDKRNDLFSHIVIAGGNTMFKGFQERLELEMSKRLLKHIVIDGFARQYCDIQSVSEDVRDLTHSYATDVYKIFCPPERMYSAWIGGSILASLSTFEEMWITKEEYDETGPSIVHKKCVN